MSLSRGEESLERAFRHVSDGWIPPQVDVLEKIQTALNDGEYDNDRGKLTQDLKEDFSLYIYCLRELSSMLGEQESESPPINKANTTANHNPVELFENTDLETFRQILDKSHKDISKHSFKEINEFQALRFKESMLSATTAEVLSDSVQVDPEFGFSCAMLRQLGLTLIAWNYPRVYSRAIENLTKETTLDASLKKTLGFSPSLLALRFARKWNLSLDLLTALGDKKALKVSAQAFGGEKGRKTLVEENVGETLCKICEVGEALARANNPEHYPTALADWETAQQVIAEQLGPKGINLIYEKAQENLKHYVKSTPELVHFVENENVEDRILGSQYSNRLIEKNVHLRHVPDSIRSQLKALYAQFKPNKILKDNIRTLMNDIIPQAGFECGCIHMFDPEKKLLSPAIRVGPVPRERLRPVKVSSVLAQFDLVASAYTLKSPLREEVANDEGKRITLIAGALGQKTPIGVLYLQTKEDFNKTVAVDAMPIYRAIRQCVCDCLNVS